MAFEIDTPRLRLTPLTEACTRASLDDRNTIAREIAAEVPLSWPVEHYDQGVLDATAKALQSTQGEKGWILRYIVIQEPRPTVAGMVGMMAPDREGACMIGYSVLPEFRRQGYAGEALAGVVAWAFDHPEVQSIIGETYPELTGSIRTMECNGFRYTGPGREERVIRYELPRSEWARQA